MKKHYKNHIAVRHHVDNRDEAHIVITQALKKKFGSAGEPVMIAVGGPGGTGKTTFAGKLSEALTDSTVLTLDDYKTSREERAVKNIFGPHPEANNIQLLVSHLKDLRAGRSIQKPVYCRQAGIAAEHVAFSPAKFVIVEGEIATYRELHEYMDFSIFIDSHWKTQLNTRIQRDIEERGYTPAKAISAFLYSNLHEFEQYGAESKHWSDIHVYCGEDYSMTIDAVCSKTAAFMVDSVSEALADVLLKACQPQSPEISQDIVHA